MAGGNKITVTVVVSGAPQQVTVNHNQKVEHVIKEALKEAGIGHAKLEEWTLRFAQGGAAIDPDSKVDAAGIKDGATLFLDPDEGGGGQVAVTPVALPEPPASPVLVDPEISRAKLSRQLADWQDQAEVYRRRGWLLLASEELAVEVGFAAAVPLGDPPDSVAIPLAVRFGFENYDLWPPSLQLIDPITSRPLQAPRLWAYDFSRRDAVGIPEQAFVGAHPDTGRTFLCKRGVREYHTHFEHSGDDWLLHRGQGIGTLAQLCEVLWRLTTRTIAGLNLAVRRFAQGEAAQVNFSFEYLQDDVDALRQQAEATPPPQPQNAVPITALPPEVLAQLKAALNQGS
jgi:hypothetical protein